MVSFPFNAQRYNEAEPPDWLASYIDSGADIPWTQLGYKGCDACEA